MNSPVRPLRKYLCPIVLGIAVFACMALYFSRLHPLYITNTDDWTYIAYWRDATPIWEDWNPTRVLPEILMPIMGAFGAYVVMPFVNDYVDAQMVSAALFVSLAVTCYVLCFYHIARQRLCDRDWTAATLSVLFLVLHFLMFREQQSDNRHLLYSFCVTNYFYYTIPNLLNASLAMLYAAGYWGKEDGLPQPTLRNGMIALCVYLALLSNLFASIILAAVVGTSLVIRLVRTIRTRGSILTYAKHNLVSIVVIVAWFIVQYYEMNGGRASSLESDTPLLARMVTTMQMLFSTVRETNHWCDEFIAISLVAGAIVCIRHQEDASFRATLRIMALQLLSLILTVAYLCVVCASSGPGFITRTDVSFAVYYVFVAASLFGCAVVLKRLPPVRIALPILTLILACSCNTLGRTYMESYMLSVAPQTMRAIDRDIVSQVVDASENGKKKVDVLVPKVSGSPDNFPFANYGGDKARNALVVHGVIPDGIQVTFVPSREKAQSYGIKQ